jgi:hypothetical protein
LRATELGQVRDGKFLPRNPTNLEKMKNVHSFLCFWIWENVAFCGKMWDFFRKCGISGPSGITGCAGLDSLICSEKQVCHTPFMSMIQIMKLHGTICDT